MAFMPGPHSYTGEDVVEIQAHAGAVVLREILSLVMDGGARLAEPGEFTKRSYLNGRMDLSQAEAVIDVIQARTETALRLAAGQLQGKTATVTHLVREQVLEVLARLEAGIDFPEDVADILDVSDTCMRLRQGVIRRLEEVLDGYRRGHLLREGLRLVILGRPNVGKSSLLNRFLEKDRAIVTDQPGTTRDSIEETLNLSGLPVILVDTAGWRQTDDPVEKIGVSRIKPLVDGADLVLFLTDAATGILPEDEAVYAEVKGKPCILVANKIDLPGAAAQTAAPAHWRTAAAVSVSVKEDLGMDRLRGEILSFATGGGRSFGDGVVPNLRQKNLFEQALAAVSDGMEGLTQGLPWELVAIDFKSALDALDAIVGVTVKTDVLDEIFSRFCIGK